MEDFEPYFDDYNPQKSEVDYSKPSEVDDFVDSFFDYPETEHPPLEDIL